VLSDETAQSTTESDATSSRSSGTGRTSARRLNAKQPSCQLNGAFGGVLDLDPSADPGRPGRAPRVHLGEPSDGRQRFVEVVGHSARQLPDGLHLGGLPQAGFELDFAFIGRTPLVLESPVLG